MTARVPSKRLVIRLNVMKDSMSLRQLSEKLDINHGTLSAIMREIPGAISERRENALRLTVGLPPMWVKTKPPIPRTRPPCYRPYLPASAGVLIRMEAARRGVTAGVLICEALGITDGISNR